MNSVIIFGVIIVGLLIFYIIARIKTNRGEMTMCTNGWDLALIIITSVLLFISSLSADNSNAFTYVTLGLSGLSLLGTLLFSIFSNLGSLWHILLSMLSKLFMVIFNIIILFILLFVLIFKLILLFFRDRDEDRYEYRVFKYDKYLDKYVGW